MSERKVRPRSVLLADADKGRRAALVCLLREAGYEPLEAGDGTEALCLLRTASPDAVLLDSQLTPQGGLPVLNQARALPQPVPVIVLGSPGSIYEVVQVMQHGARNYLVRPLIGGEISEALREALQARSALVATPREPEEQLLQARKMEALGRLASGVAHDFNNLLTVIAGYGELLLNNLPTTHPSRSCVQDILRAVDRGTSVTRDLLAFSRKSPPQPAVLDLNEVVTGTERMLRRLIGEQLELRKELAAEVCPVKAVRGQLEQVLVNLAVNARDAMLAGGRLTLRTDNDVALPSMFGDEVGTRRWVLLSASDTGVGMDEQTRAHIFEPFFTTKEAGKGTGLGLAVVAGFMGQCGGHIEVHSELGLGTTFNLYFPQAPEALGTLAVTEVQPADGPRGSETVLLLEDEEAVRRVVQTMLVQQGYRVLTANDGQHALVLAAEHAGPIHLLVSDVVMPRMSGPDVARRLLQGRPSLRVLYITGYLDNPILQQAHPQGNVATLAKPFTASVLAYKVRELLDRG